MLELADYSKHTIQYEYKQMLTLGHREVVGPKVKFKLDQRIVAEVRLVELRRGGLFGCRSTVFHFIH